MIVIFFVVNEFGSKVLYPRLVGSATGLHEIVVLFVLLAGAEVGGVIGALLAVPLTALFGLLALYAYRIWSQSGRPGEPMPSPPAIDAAAPHEGLPSRPPELLASRRESEIEAKDAVAERAFGRRPCWLMVPPISPAAHGCLVSTSDGYDNSVKTHATRPGRGPD